MTIKIAFSYLMYTCTVYVCKLWLKNHWVTLHPWVCHPKCSLCLLAIPKESLAYTVLTAFASRSLQRKKSYSLFRQKPIFVSPKNLTPYWSPKDVKSSSIIEEFFARVNTFAFMSFNTKVQNIISIIIAHKHCHLTPGM